MHWLSYVNLTSQNILNVLLKVKTYDWKSTKCLNFKWLFILAFSSSHGVWNQGASDKTCQYRAVSGAISVDLLLFADATSSAADSFLTAWYLFSYKNFQEFDYAQIIAQFFAIAVIDVD